MRQDRINLLLAILAALVLFVDAIAAIQYVPSFSELFDSYDESGVEIPLPTQLLMWVYPWIGILTFVPILLAGVSIFLFVSPESKKVTTWILGFSVLFAFSVIPLMIWILYLPVLGTADA